MYDLLIFLHGYESFTVTFLGGIQEDDTYYKLALHSQLILWANVLLRVQDEHVAHTEVEQDAQRARQHAPYSRAQYDDHTHVHRAVGETIRAYLTDELELVVGKLLHLFQVSGRFDILHEVETDAQLLVNFHGWVDIPLDLDV